MKTSEQELKNVDPRRRIKVKAMAVLIKKGRGILKREAGGRQLTEDWAERKRREQALEERHV